MTLSITVPGDPETQGSMKAFVRGKRAVVVHDESARLNFWRGLVAITARRAWGRAPRLDEPVALAVTFRLARPAGHYGTGRNAGTVRPSAPALPHKKPDLDKLVRAIGDALTEAGIWADDSRVVQLTATKVYAGPGEEPGVDVTVAPLGGISQCRHDVVTSTSLAA